MKIYFFRTLVYALLLLYALPACTPEKVVLGPFLKLSAVETDLKKGISTKTDVRRILGSPQGFGSALLPTSPTEYEVWFYENIETSHIEYQTNANKPGTISMKRATITMDVDQKMLLVFFSKDLFDGFFWFTTTAKGSTQ